MQTIVTGVVVEGYRVASGPSKDYPYGSLEKQIPLFKERGLDLEAVLLRHVECLDCPAYFRDGLPRNTPFDR